MGFVEKAHAPSVPQSTQRGKGMQSSCSDVHVLQVRQADGQARPSLGRAGSRVPAHGRRGLRPGLTGASVTAVVRKSER